MKELKAESAKLTAKYFQTWGDQLTFCSSPTYTTYM